MTPRPRQGIIWLRRHGPTMAELIPHRQITVRFNGRPTFSVRHNDSGSKTGFSTGPVAVLDLFFFKLLYLILEKVICDESARTICKHNKV